MRNIITEEYIRESLLEFEYMLLSYYKDKNILKAVIIDKDEYMYDASFYNIINGNPPYFVGKSNPYSLRNIFIWLLKNEKTFSLSDETTYINAHEKLKFNCEICKDFFYMNWNNIYRGHDCGVCDGVQLGGFHNLKFIYPFLAGEWDYSKNEISPEFVTCGTNNKYWWICSVCNHNWKTSVDERVRGKSGCPKCASSKGEMQIHFILNKYNILFKEEKWFSDCLDKGLLFFDFYIPLLNICIEYQGQQHYEPVDFAGRGLEWAKSEFKKNQRRDKIKEDYCRNNNINLLIIPYWEFDNIEELYK